MDRGDVLVFNTKDGDYKDWKYFRVIEAVTIHNKEDEGSDKVTGSKMYLQGNVMTKGKKDGVKEDGSQVLKSKRIFIADFFNLATKGEANVADEAEAALLFLTNTKF